MYLIRWIWIHYQHKQFAGERLKNRILIYHTQVKPTSSVLSCCPAGVWTWFLKSCMCSHSCTLLWQITLTTELLQKPPCTRAWPLNVTPRFWQTPRPDAHSWSWMLWGPKNLIPRNCLHSVQRQSSKCYNFTGLVQACSKHGSTLDTNNNKNCVCCMYGPRCTFTLLCSRTVSTQSSTS